MKDLLFLESKYERQDVDKFLCKVKAFLFQPKPYKNILQI